MRGPKPDKPRANFPLTAHPNGTWCKKINRKVYYFGGWSDPEGAEREYLRTKDHLQAGEEPPPKSDTRISMVDLCNEFLESKQLLVESGELTQGMHFDYQRACARLLKIVGRNTIVEELKPRDFDRIRAKLTEGEGKNAGTSVSKVTLANRVRLARIIFKFASDQDLIEKPVKFGQNFKQPDKAALRAERQKKPAMEFTSEELRSIIDRSKSPLKAMILLGINCAFGQNDCASLRSSALDLKAGWVNFPRPKTAVERRCPLWPETLKAIKLAIANRPTAAAEEFSGLVFITKYGNPYVRTNAKGSNLDAVAGEFAKVLDELNLAGNRRAFYSLRRTFETIGGESLDQISVDFIMGHSPPSEDMGAVYRQHISDDRLKAVTGYVRSWLWPKPRRKLRQE